MFSHLPPALKPVLAFIPARAGSKGVPNKNLRTLDGKSLMQLAIECAKSSSIFDRIVVSSDGEEILKEATRYGAETIQRPPELAIDSANILDSITHTLQFLFSQGYQPASIALLEPSSPFRTPALVQQVVSLLSEHEAAFTVTEVDLKFHPAKQFILNDQRIALPSCSNLASPVNRQELDPTFIRNGGVYAFRTEMFLREKSVLGKRPRAFITKEVLINIDTMADYKLAQKLIQKINK